MLKKILVLVFALLMCMAGVVSVFAAEDKTLSMEMDGMVFEMPARVLEGELFLPLRAISEELGFEVQWNGENKEINISKHGNIIKLNLLDYKINVNGHESYLTTGYKLLNDRTYLHHDFFPENLGINAVQDEAGNKVVLQRTEENPIVISTKAEASETDTLKLTIQYPELKGLDNTEVQGKLNSLFARLAAEAKDRAYEVEKYIGQDEISRHIKAEAYFNYQVKYNNNGMLSIVFMDYVYSGGAHGGTVQSSYTFDLKTGTEYQLKDLFPEGYDYVSLISNEVKRQLAEMEMTVLLAPFDSIRADHDFYLFGNSIIVYFQQYEILPYAYGIPEFSVDRQPAEQ